MKNQIRSDDDKRTDRVEVSLRGVDMVPWGDEKEVKHFKYKPTVTL